ncbi:TPA: ATP-binding cassette domain-containing protein [bacterium]|nr:ATP-binding cassette domain-containing protein [bacterium]
MLRLNNIIKHYKVGNTRVEALRGVSLNFRKNEFVSILGPSGCGKTTLLNIIGGLDRYTRGSMHINNKPTSHFSDQDWDSYRNHSVGFVFQNYNLIMHINVLSNVELALTLSGISASERKKRAIEALERVGLKDQIYKKPNQLSGGQMQRVAIARALVNNPEILLADEPTGALDTKTSAQIMDLLKEIAKDRLVIMVTHNSDIAYKYSTRIIKLQDGLVIDDSNPYEVETKKVIDEKYRPVKTSMSFFTALSLSFRNLSTKKIRTALTSFAGSIGIIGIALVLALSNGFRNYIAKVQSDTLTAYPLTISETAIDFSQLQQSNFMNNLKEFPEEQKVNINKISEKMGKVVIKNKITDDYVENYVKTLNPNLYNAISFDYGVKLNVYQKVDVNNMDFYTSVDTSSWQEIPDNYDFINSQYDKIGGSFPQEINEIALVVDKYNQITDVTLFSLGLYKIGDEIESLDFNEIIGKEYKLILNDDLYKEDESGLKFNKEVVNEELYNGGTTLKITGILRVKKDINFGALTSTVVYTKGLTEHVLENSLSSNIVKWQLDHPTINVFSGEPFQEKPEKSIEAQYQEIIKDLGGRTTPVNISIYPKDFASKELIKEHLDKYNESITNDEDKIFYTDMMETILNTINTIIDVISYILIAFTAVSLVVSSIMIGIITYISVLERTKEIGILRSIGARKKDISRVFNAETIIIGFISGLIGVIFTIIVSFPINIILGKLVEIEGLASLNLIHGIILIVISMTLTLISGLIPSSIAAKKDPVEALRTE